MAAYSMRSDRYKYRENSDVEDGNEDFAASLPSDNDDKDLSGVEVLEKSKPKRQRRRVGTARGSSTLVISAKRNSVISAKKYQIQISTLSLMSYAVALLVIASLFCDNNAN